MQLELDREAGLAYLRRSNSLVSRTVEVSPSINADIDELGELVGIEIIDFHAELPADVLVESYGLDSVELGLLRSLSS
ncbi:unannotated protein [freshwater metagenome]|uniref:Unannotated protein n=1 Tax=freshwater metagenome TaxID=449393 RepID=A0A6J7JV28_9ZZZZ|nr:DUF2283 domain-containing protein [Actinomycetota bacterium]